MNTQNINNSETKNRVNNSKPSFYSKMLFFARISAMMKDGMSRSDAFKKGLGDRQALPPTAD